MEFFIIYLVTTFINFKCALFWIGLILVFTLVGYGWFRAMYIDGNEQYYKRQEIFEQTWHSYKQTVKKISIALLIIILINPLFPTKDDIKFIIGGGLAWKGVQSAAEIEGAAQLPENLINAMNHFLTEIADEPND